MLPAKVIGKTVHLCVYTALAHAMKLVELNLLTLKKGLNTELEVKPM